MVMFMWDGNTHMTSLPAGASLAAFIAEKRGQGKRVFTTSRSAAITHQRCPRRRYLGYHYEGTGITKTKLATPLATGGYTHVALAELLKGKDAFDACGLAAEQYEAECTARGLDLESTENQTQVMIEQRSLVVAFTHLAARRVIPQLLEEYEIVDVEREEWFVLYEDGQLVVVMEARSDGLLREKTAQVCDGGVGRKPVELSSSGDLYVLSWKTAASWDRRKAREAKTDMQGLSEAYAIELRVGEPVMGTKMVHLLKGKRKEYPEGSGNYIQSSPLVHAWMNSAGPTPQFAWTFNWSDPDQVNDWGKPVQHRLGKGWKHVFIPDVMPVAEWVQMLDEGVVQPEAGDALDRQFVAPMPEPRSPEQKKNWLEQIEAQEVHIVDFLQQLEAPPPHIHGAGVTDDVRASYNEQHHEGLMNAMFPQFTHSCNYPGHCSFWELCWSSEEVDNPITLYQIREPHHPGEQMIMGDDL